MTFDELCIKHFAAIDKIARAVAAVLFTIALIFGCLLAKKVHVMMFGYDLSKLLTIVPGIALAILIGLRIRLSRYGV